MTTPTMPREITVGTGAGGLATTDMVLNIGPQHPATHGVLRLRLVVDGERIVSAEPIVGYMHRGAEKLFEVRDYRQIMVLANRHDWLSGFANELGVVLGVEAMLGMEVPERATWTRTLLAELTRVMSHLVFLGSYPLELGAITPIFYSFREREELQACLEEATGGRMHLMFNQVGGLKEDLPAGWLGRLDSAIQAVRGRMPDIESLLVGNEIIHARTRGVGVLSPETIAAYGVSGPIARASGVDMDLRRDEPYLAYAGLFDEGGPGRVVTRTAGDALARLSWDSFLPFVNTDFTFGEGSNAVSMKLVDMTDTKPVRTRVRKGQECFILKFHGPFDKVLKQGTFRVNHFNLGDFDLFITDGGRLKRNQFYTAVINRIIN